MSDKDWRVDVQWMIGDFSRKWGVSAKWMGWYRMLTVGASLNFAAPAVGFWLGGWSVAIGRIPRSAKTYSVKIPDGLDAIVDGKVAEEARKESD